MSSRGFNRGQNRVEPEVIGQLLHGTALGRGDFAGWRSCGAVHGSHRRDVDPAQVDQHQPKRVAVSVTAPAGREDRRQTGPDPFGEGFDHAHRFQGDDLHVQVGPLIDVAAIACSRAVRTDAVNTGILGGEVAQ
ncbi:hypothetical protein [Streptomyces sp. NPDC005322]|uniref:hypothetical protein n=1 Tax=Streptomyces sp. NPDC005322 TaxID=3157032 RepID=UPI0033BDBCED